MYNGMLECHYKHDAGAGKRLVKLELMDNPLSSEVSGALAALVRGQPQLRILNLSDTGLGDDGVTELADALGEGELVSPVLLAMV